MIKRCIRMSKRKKLLLSSIMCSLILGMSAAPVSAETIETFNRYIEGSQLLFNHLSDKINTHKFSITVDGRSFEFKPVKIFKRGKR